MDQWDKTGSPEIDHTNMAIDSDKDAKAVQWRKDSISNKWF